MDRRLFGASSTSVPIRSLLTFADSGRTLRYKSTASELPPRAANGDAGGRVNLPDDDPVSGEVYTARNHEILWRSVWLMQPLLPSEFTGNRGRRKPGDGGPPLEKNDGKNLNSPPVPSEDVAATTRNGLTREHASQRNQEPSAAGHFGCRDVAVQGQSDSLAGGSSLRWDAQPGPPPRLSDSNGGQRFKSAYPDFEKKHPDLIGVLQDLADAQHRVIEAQARLIRRLQIGAVDGQRSEAASPKGTL